MYFRDSLKALSRPPLIDPMMHLLFLDHGNLPASERPDPQLGTGWRLVDLL